tara:strand:- start:102 stop:548 length:447 start_codon:yes stop_codon:yes gene_type:complete
MKSDLEKILKDAEEHHERVRLEAVDSAFDLEEEVKTAQQNRDNTEKDLCERDRELDKVTEYLGMFEKSPAVKMLEKASASGLDLKQLQQDHAKVKETLDKLRGIQSDLVKQCDALKAKSAVQDGALKDLTVKYKAAEANADSITELSA